MTDGTRRFEPSDVARFRDHGTLEVLDGPSKGTKIEIDQKKVLVGRAEGCDLVLADARVSSAHLELEATDVGVVARDLETTNGTLVGALRIREVVLADGTELKLGGVLLRFSYGEVPERVRPPTHGSFGRLVGEAPSMQALYSDLAQLAPTQINLLVEGETGTGKEEVARAIHQASERSDGPFVIVDCGALAPTLLESTLFGHEKGAFSGATDKKIGLLEAADGGTVFLDELGELPAEAQTRLLRVLEARTIRRVGASKETAVDLRVVSATHKDIPAMISRGEFRADLFFRLATARVRVPALRERRTDVPLLAKALLHRLGFDPVPAIDEEAMTALIRRDYPGNVRELRNTLEVAAALSKTGTISAEALRRRAGYAEAAILQAAPPILKQTEAAPTSGWSGNLGLFREEKAKVLIEFERAYLARLIEEHQGNITHAAAHAGVERHHLRKLLRKHGLLPKR